ncbi:hypothetical protein SNE40_015945 [Patella caerulea]|uniref:Transporter n=1 Tax=Patella caerulea TaxID=87958 RepID=A0AAN8J900_PATCE
MDALNLLQQQRRDSDTMVGYLSDLTLSSSDDDSSDEENKLRGNWSNRLDFVLSCLGYIVGLGNVWRFPYLVYRNGGGAFFIPYLIMLLFCGIPLVYMELAFGQYASLGPITIWKAVPLFKGIGYAMVVVSMFVAVYYNMVNAWAAYYLFTSMTSVLPWQSCNNTWNTDKCHINKYEVSNCSGVNLTYAESPEFDSNCSSVLTNCTLYNTTEIVQCIKELQDTFGNEVLDPKFLHHHRTSPSEEYFYLSVLDVSPGIHQLGSIRWQLALCLLMCWTIIFICLVKGIQMSGKISYFMVTFPYIIILILLIRGMTMDGCLEGIKYYVTPKWELLRHPRVWGDAATQVFFSLSLCLGGLTTLASYNKFHNNIYRDAILVCLGDTLMSVMAGFAVFAVIGVLGKKLGTSVENVIKSDVGLTFIVYPEAILSFPISPLWSILFFLMMFMMGLSTLFTSVETIVTAIIDENITKFRKKRVLVLFVLCLSAFLLGLPLTTQGGIYILQLMDEFVAGFPPMINAVFMCIAIGWTYGVKQFCQDIMHMIGTPVSWWWRIMWYGVSPSIITFILIFSAVGYIPLRRQFDETKYPEWAEVVGFILVTICIIPVFAWIVYRLVSIKGSIIQRLKKLCQPETDWGPALEKHWKYVEYYPAVHTQMFPSEMDNAALNTITDHVEFTTVGVRVPSLSQASLIPVSPSLPRTKKPLDMRQQAILNHAYSNPQCNLSTSSIEKLGMKRICSASESALDDIIIMPRIRPKVEMKDAATQTQTSTLCKDVSSSLSASTSSQIEDEVFEVNSPTKEKDTEVVQAIPKESSPTRKVSWNADIQLHHENRPTLIRRLSWTQKQNNTHSPTVPTRRYSLGLNHPIIYRDPLLPPKRNLLIKQDSLTQTTSLAVPTRKVSWNKDTERSPVSPSRKVSWSPEIEFYNRILSRPDIHNVSPLQKLSVSEDIELQTSPSHDSYEDGNQELANTEKCVEQQVELQSVDIYNESTVTTHVAYTSDSEDSLFADDQPAVIDVEVTHF